MVFFPFPVCSVSSRFIFPLLFLALLILNVIFILLFGHSVQLFPSRFFFFSFSFFSSTRTSYFNCLSFLRQLFLFLSFLRHPFLFLSFLRHPFLFMSFLRQPFLFMLPHLIWFYRQMLPRCPLLLFYLSSSYLSRRLLPAVC